jgi:hypothetical protein
MRERRKILLVFNLIVFLIVPSLSQNIVKTVKPNENQTTSLLNNSNQELDLLHGETYIKVIAFENISHSVNFSYVVPPIYGYQAPILIELRNDTTANIISYRVYNDTNNPNKIINFIIAPMKKDENATFHFDFLVLVKDQWYTDFPTYIRKPLRCQLPEETKIWLEPTNVIQSNALRIKLTAFVLKGFNTNILKIARRISNFTFGKIEYLGGGLQDAFNTLRNKQGVCTGKANLGTALFRASGIPAKDLIVMPTNNVWFYMHFISEYYCSYKGWILVETTMGRTPFRQKHDIILRINYPEDENNAGVDGSELYYWIDSKNVDIAMDPLNGSGSRAWIENNIMIDKSTANLTFNLTQEVYSLHTKYIGMDLNETNTLHYTNALIAQQNAINCFMQSDVLGYFNNMTIAYDEYNQINVY